MLPFWLVAVALAVLVWAADRGLQGRMRRVAVGVLGCLALLALLPVECSTSQDDGAPGEQVTSRTSCRTTLGPLVGDVGAGGASVLVLVLLVPAVIVGHRMDAARRSRPGDP